MPALLSCALQPIPMETVPAIKITHFNGSPKADQIYAYARLYAINDTICFSLTRFEEKPADSVRMGIALANADNCTRILFLSASFNGEGTLRIYNNGDISQDYSVLRMQISHGGDEQGLYYTAEGIIPQAIIRESLGVNLSQGTVLAGNIYSYDITERAFGSAFKTPLSEALPTLEGLETIICVSY